MRSRDIFGRLRLRLQLRGSIPAPAPAPSKTVRRLQLRLRLRAKCTGSGGSGSGSDDQVLIWALTRNTIFKNVKFQNMTSYWRPWVWMLLWMSVFEICHSLSSKATGWHWRDRRLLRVALSEISGLGPKWSFATDAQRILNIRKRLSARDDVSGQWHGQPDTGLPWCSDNKNACFWQWRKFQVINCTCSEVIDEKYRQFVFRCLLFGA